MELNIILQDQIKRFALENPTEECCGLIYLDENEYKLHPCINKAKDKRNDFLIDSAQIFSIDRLAAIYHSHLNYSEFSLADKIFSEKLHVANVVYCIKTNSFSTYIPNGYLIPYEQRPFYLGVSDCVTLVQDYYIRELNIKLPNFSHPARYMLDSWHTPEFENIYPNNSILLDYFTSCGFKNTNKLNKHNIILSKLPNTNFPVHSSIYINENKILHHLYDLSSFSSYTNAHKRLTTNYLTL